MAVPRYQQQVIPFTGNIPGVQTDVTGIGRGIGNVAEMLAARHERMRAADERMRRIQLDKEFADMRLRSMEVRGAPARGMTDTLSGMREQMRSQNLDQIEDPVTRQSMEAYFDKSFNDQLGWTGEYELKQHDEFLKTEEQAARENDNLMLNQTKIGDTEAIDQRILDMVQGTGKIQGPYRWSEQMASKYAQEVADEYYTGQINRWFKEDPEKSYNWFKRNQKELELKLSPTAFNNALGLYRSNYDKAQTSRIFREVTDEFGDNYRAGAIAVSDLKNFEKYGIKEEEHRLSSQVATRLRKLQAMDDTLDEKQRKDKLDKLTDQISQMTADVYAIKDPAARRASLENLERYIQTLPELETDERNKLVDNIYKANYRARPSAVTDMQDRIDRGDVTRNYQIRLEQMNGIGDAIPRLESYLAKKLENDKSGHMDYYKRALDTFDKIVERKETVSGKKLSSADRSEYARKLKAKQRMAGLPNNDPAIVDLETEMLAKMWRDEKTGEVVTPNWLKQQFPKIFGLREMRGFKAEDEAVQNEIYKMSQEAKGTGEQGGGGQFSMPAAEEMPAAAQAAEKVESQTDAGISPEGAPVFPDIGQLTEEAVTSREWDKTRKGPKGNLDQQKLATDFDYFLQNPNAVPGDTVEEKLKQLEAYYEIAMDTMLSEEDRELIEKEIRGATAR